MNANSVDSSKIVDGSINTIDLANNAVTTALLANNSIDGTKIALGSDTAGDIMYYNGTDWVRFAAGTSGQVLQTTGTAPIWV